MQIAFDKITILRFGPIFDMIGDIKVDFSCAMPFEKDIRYSFSIDGENFSNWFENLDDFFIQYKEMLFVKNATYIRIRIETAKYEEKEDLVNQISEQIGWDTNIYLKISINGIETQPDSIDVLNPGEFIVKNPAGLWTPYKGMEQAFELWQSSAEAINQMFGHWAYYFSTKPQEADKSVIFKQYTLHNVTDMKLIRVSVPGNNMPDGRNQYSEFGITLPDEFSIQILTKSFQQAFGYNAIPNENDYLYLPITGKMYSIASIYETKQFMQKAIMYQAILQIFSKAENVDDTGFDFNQFINTISPGADTQNELDDIDVSAKDYMNLMYCEQYRKFIHNKLQIVEWDFSINGVNLFTTAYDLASIQRNELAIVYNCKFSESNQTTSQNLSLSFWVNFGQIKSGHLFDLVHKNKTGEQLPFATIGIEQKKLVIHCNNKILESEQLDNRETYAIAISFSGQYNVMMLTIAKFSEESGFEIVTDTYIQIGTIKTPIVGLNMFALPCMISNISLDEHIIETDEFVNYLTRVFPEKDNVIFDKAQKQISEVPFAQ